MALEDRIRQVLIEANTGNTADTGITYSDNAKIEAGKKNKESIKGEEPKEVTKGDGSEPEVAADNAKIEAGKRKKLETSPGGEIPAGAPDNENNKKNFVDTNPQGGVKEHIDALTDGEELSEEFKQKAAVILEAAIADGVAKEIERLEEEYTQQLVEAVEEVREDLEANIDGFLNLMVEKWIEANEVALESGIKNEVLENFVDGLKTLFKETYIELPEEKLDILDEQANEIDVLNDNLGEAVNIIENLEARVIELTKTRIQESVGDLLTDKDFEKFAQLCEGVEFTSEDAYESKLKTVKESYFPTKTQQNSVIAEGDTPVPQALTEGSIAKYAAALSNPLAFKR